MHFAYFCKETLTVIVKKYTSKSKLEKKRIFFESKEKGTQITSVY